MPAAVVFSGLDPLVVEGVVDEGGRILVQARTPSGPAACPGCGVESARVHGYHQRIVADLSWIDGLRWCGYEHADMFAQHSTAATPSANKCPMCWNATSGEPRA